MRDGDQVDAGFLEHTVPCWGYVFSEFDQVGSLDVIKLMRSPLGHMRAGPWLSKLKAGEAVTAEDGTVVTQADVCGPTLVGRKIVSARACERPCIC